MPYKIHAGMHTMDAKGNEVRYEPGDVVDFIRPESLPWLLRDGHVTEVTAPAPPPPAPAPVVVQAPVPAPAPSIPEEAEPA